MAVLIIKDDIKVQYSHRRKLAYMIYGALKDLAEVFKLRLRTLVK